MDKQCFFVLLDQLMHLDKQRCFSVEIFHLVAYFAIPNKILPLHLNLTYFITISKKQLLECFSFLVTTTHFCAPFLKLVLDCFFQTIDKELNSNKPWKYPFRTVLKTQFMDTDFAFCFQHTQNEDSVRLNLFFGVATNSRNQLL